MFHPFLSSIFSFLPSLLPLPSQSFLYFSSVSSFFSFPLFLSPPFLLLLFTSSFSIPFLSPPVIPSPLLPLSRSLFLCLLLSLNHSLSISFSPYFSLSLSLTQSLPLHLSLPSFSLSLARTLRCAVDLGLAPSSSYLSSRWAAWPVLTFLSVPVRSLSLSLSL